MEMHPSQRDLRIAVYLGMADHAPGAGRLHYWVLKQWESHVPKIRLEPLPAVTIP